MMLAYSNGGSASMIEKYESGRQDVNYYSFYPGYTQLVFVANEVGRHILTFYGIGQQSNSIIIDVVPYGGSYVPGYTLPTGQPSSRTVKINIGVLGTGSGQTSGSNQATGQGCNILGTWSFGENGPYNIINADGTILAKDDLNGESFDSGTWRVIDASRRLYRFTWQSGWSHTFTLSADCSSLDGYGRLNGGAEQPGHGVRVSGTGGEGYSNTNTGYPQTFIDSVDQGFDPNAHIGDYEETSTQSGKIMVDSTANGFNPTAPPQGEAI
jgi:hypothetical protein